MDTLVPPEPTDSKAVLKRRHATRMKFSELGALLADEDFADNCIIGFRWDKEHVDFRFSIQGLPKKQIVVRVKMNDSEGEIFERFVVAQEMIEKELKAHELDVDVEEVKE